MTLSKVQVSRFADACRPTARFGRQINSQINSRIQQSDPAVEPHALLPGRLGQRLRGDYRIQVSEVGEHKQ